MPFLEAAWSGSAPSGRPRSLGRSWCKGLCVMEAPALFVVVVGALGSSRTRMTPADVCVGAVERMKRVRKAARREKRLLRTSIVFQRGWVVNVG